jgi:hypothetical protein
MVRDPAPTPSGDDMGTTPNDIETARIEALLSRLEVDAGGACQVPGCTHVHASAGAGELPAIAA